MKSYTRTMCLVFFLAPLMAGCTSQLVAPVINPAADFALTATEERALIVKVNRNHDADAAFRLSLYHLYNRERNLYWLTKAARYGNAVAQYNLAYALAEKGTTDDLAKARYWLNRAEKFAVATNNRALIESIPYLRSDLGKLKEVR